MSTRPSLRPVPESPSRALGMVRVSKEREGMVSPEVQRIAISDYCAARGYVVAGWLEGIDESGSRAKSAWWPRLDQAVSEVESGEYDVIVVWKFSRTARHRLRWAVAIDRVEEAGGRLESATEQFDTSTSSGRLARGMLAELNAFEAERIGEGWREAHARRVASGRPANGLARWGYVYDRDRKIHVPDPVTGPTLAEMYRRYTAGESVYALVRWLNAHGWRTGRGGLWSERALRRVLDSGFAAGMFLAGGTRGRVKPVMHPGEHQPLIDEAAWQAYLDARGVRRQRAPRTERSPYVLSGLVRCSRCGGAMVGNASAASGPRYRCHTAKEQGKLACQGGYVQATFVEAHVLEHLAGMAEPVEEVAASYDVGVGRQWSLQVEEDRLARELGRVEESFTRMLLQDARDPLPAQVWAEARARLDGEQRALSAALDDVQRQRRRAPDDVALVAAGLLRDWDTTAVTVRREVLRSLVDCVLVTTGRPPRYRVVEWAETRSV